MEHRESQRTEASATDEQSLAPGLENLDPGEIVHAATEFARENPHTAIAGALAIGFLLGGGLTPRLLGSLAVVAVRRYAAEAARGALSEAVGRQMDEKTAH